MSNSTNPLLLQFLSWVGEHPRTYADVMDAWRTSCPRLTIWEDALRAGYIEFRARTGAQAGEIALTPRGQAVLQSRPAAKNRDEK